MFLLFAEQVTAMGPLIDAALEKVDRRHAQLTQLSSDLVDALNLYHTLMREPAPSTPSGYTLPKMQPPHISYSFHNPGPPPHVSTLSGLKQHLYIFFFIYKYILVHSIIFYTFIISEIFDNVSYGRCLTVCHLHFLLGWRVPARCPGHITQVFRATSTWVLPVCQTWLYRNIFICNLALTNNIRLDIHRRDRLCRHPIKLASLINNKGMFAYNYLFISIFVSQKIDNENVIS